MPDYLPRFRGQTVTFTASADVTGGRLVSVTGSRAVGPSVADSAAVVGVAGYDTLAGEKVTVYLRPGGVHPLVTSGPITIGQQVCADTNGRISATGTQPLGIALEPATTSGDVIDVLFI